MVTDPIADMLTRIRNAGLVQHSHVAMPASKIKVEIAKILVEEGFVAEFKVSDEQPQATLLLTLKYTGKGIPVINGIERVSKPGRRIYAGHGNIPWVRSGLGINILSTPNGLMTGRKARRAHVGGEILANVW